MLFDCRTLVDREAGTSELETLSPSTDPRPKGQSPVPFESAMPGERLFAPQCL
jgi:hypothetical protein